MNKAPEEIVLKVADGVDYCVRKARQLAENHDAWRYTQNNGRKPWDRSRLRVRVRDSEKGPNLLNVVWVAYEKGDRYAKHIPKGGNQDRYPTRRLQRYAQSWEWQAVWEMEQAFAEIRKTMRILQKLRTEAMALIKARESLQATLEEQGYGNDTP